MALISVEVVWATPEQQQLVALQLAPGSTVEAAIEQSGFYRRFAGHGLESADVGIWGRVVPRTHTVEDGDRVEIYRPLRMDPREARRQRA
ncbi:MAG: RnfH family protein [Woeseiaceae bacterium]|nr:RnfH family protein [Woeseiaceae bacterium]